MGVSDVKVAFISDEIAADPDGISASAQVANNAALVIGGALHVGNAYSSAGSARKIVVVSGGNDSGISFTVTGTDIAGDALVETFLGANAGTATSTKYFQTVSGISAVGDPAGTVTAGTSADALDKVFFGRVRLKGYSIVSGGTAGVIEFFNGNPNGTGSALFKARTIGTDNTTVDNTIPLNGIVFEDGLYVVYTNTTVDMMSFFYA
tara:strand:- start:198 stop:818 length:621 start_codon:yes stop_codon:yes gene_type:complete